LFAAVITYVRFWPAATGDGVAADVMVTSARGATVFVMLLVLFTVFGSAVVAEKTDTLFVRGPPSPPGRTAISMRGQVLPATQGGNEGIVQVTARPEPPEAALLQFTDDAVPLVTTVTETKP